MFTFYLFAFAFLSPWRDAQQLADSTGLVCDNRPSGNYSSFLDTNNPTNSSFSGDDLESTVTFEQQDDGSSDDPGGTTLRSRQPIEPVGRLSESTFVPIKDGSGGDFNQEELTHTCKHSSKRGGGGKSKGSSVDGGSINSSTEDEEEESSSRSVRFNRMAEVREMSPLDAPDALLARLSYSASLRMRRQKSHHKTARTALMFSILVRELSFNFPLAMSHFNPFFFSLPVVRRKLLIPVGVGPQRKCFGHCVEFHFESLHFALGRGISFHFRRSAHLVQVFGCVSQHWRSGVDLLVGGEDG